MLVKVADSGDDVVEVVGRLWPKMTMVSLKYYAIKTNVLIYVTDSLVRRCHLY